MKVLGLGTAAIDTVLKCDHFPKEDGFAAILEEKTVPGGSCVNVLVTLSKLNINTSLLAKLGNDSYGEILFNDIDKNKISTSDIIIKENGSTLRTFIIVGEQGKKKILFNMGNCLLDLKPEEVKEDIVKDVDVFYTDMYPIKPALKIARLCKKSGINIVVNLQSSINQLKDTGATLVEIEEMIGLSDIFCSHKSEILSFSREDNYESAVTSLFNKYKPRLGIIATCGDEGAIWKSKTRLIKSPSFEVEATDTTGAGDAFLGGLIYSVFEKKNTYEKSLQFANACAAIKCTQLGPRIKVDFDQVENFINNLN